MNSTDANERMISIEAAVKLWRTGAIDSEAAVTRVHEVLSSLLQEQPSFGERRYDKPLG